MDYKNIFSLPTIPDNQIIDIDENHKETLILRIPIESRRGLKYAYFKPPSFLKHYEYTKELTVLQLFVLERHKIIENLDNNVNIKVQFSKLLELFMREQKIIMKFVKKYLHFKKGKKACSFRWFVRNANFMQVQKVIAYVLLLPECVKKNESFLNQKLNIIRQSQILNGHSEKSATGARDFLPPRY